MLFHAMDCLAGVESFLPCFLDFSTWSNAICQIQIGLQTIHYCTNGLQMRFILNSLQEISPELLPFFR